MRSARLDAVSRAHSTPRLGSSPRPVDPARLDEQLGGIAERGHGEVALRGHRLEVELVAPSHDVVAVAVDAAGQAERLRTRS
jgi:hypothetical protein